MKRVILSMFLILLAAQVFAGEGLYQQVCRQDDPFVYCTQGCKETKAWKPASMGSAGYASVAYRPQVPYCPYPTTQCCDSYCALRPWPQRDYNDYMQNRIAVCPAAHHDGRWTGSGQPEDAPGPH